MPEALPAPLAWLLAVAPGLVGPVYPLVSAAHILSIALLVGPIVALDLRLLGVFRAVPLRHLALPLSRVATAGLAGALVTGTLLFSVQPAEYLGNRAFLLKLALIAIGLFNALVLRRLPAWGRVDEPGRAAVGPVQASALVSLLVWVAAVLSGRWIAFL